MGLAVAVEHLSKAYGNLQALKDVSLEIKEGEFFEVYVNTPMEIAEQRDPKGLYIKARNGQIKNFTGIDSKYEPPNNPEIIITPSLSQEEIIAKLISYL